jgi:hypothetical protein
MIALALFALIGQDADSPVHRAAFEDRSRMVLVQLAAHRWMAFNPKTCAIQKIWEGDVDWKGKVFDFSQENSRAKGKVLFELPSRITDLGKGWTTTGATLANGVVTFQSDQGSIETSFEASDFANVFVAFDETSRAAPFRIDVIQSGKTTEWFDSATSGGSDTDWQWNFKQIWPGSAMTTVRFSSAKASAKKLRNARIFGDYEMWTLPTIWRGYDVTRAGVTLRYDLKRPDGKVVEVKHSVGEEQTIVCTGDTSGVSYRLPPGLGLASVEYPGVKMLPAGAPIHLKLEAAR